MKCGSPKFTKGVVTHHEAYKLAPVYVKFIEEKDYAALHAQILPAFGKLRVGQAVLTFAEGVYVKAKVTSIRQPNWDADGPVVRVGNGEYTWRVDGNRYAYPL